MKNLRTGFTTGACVCAASAVAFQVLYGCNANDLKKIGIEFPDSQIRFLNILDIKINNDDVDVSIKKDGGDDIDITNNAIIKVKLSIFNQNLLDSDIKISNDNIDIVLRRGQGVGIVTNDMLDVPNGKVAINPQPQKMILRNLDILSKKMQKFNPILIEVSVENGVALAKKTLNSVLGVVEGISILGTSGIVIPCSHNAYKKTILMLIKGAANTNDKKIMLVTGGKTHRLLKEMQPDFPEIKIIRMGDFIQESISQAKKYAIDSITIGCMPGKLAKYALGYGYTHAHNVRTDMQKIAKILDDYNIDKKIVNHLQKASTIRSFIMQCEPEIVKQIYNIWALKALKVFKQWNNQTKFKIMLFGFNTEFCGEWRE